MFPARLDRLRAVRQFLDAFCANAGVGNDDCQRLNLVVEELFTNTVRHGHRGDSDSPVWVSVAADGKRVEISYEDSAPPFNPYGQGIDQTLKMARPGGLGVLLTRKLASSRDYAYLYGRNRIRLALALD
jgi:anti-sigma regulatory factor (Ser/Thr protein kinase)